MTSGPYSVDIDAEVQRRQRVLLARAQRRSRTVETSDVRPSPWRHVPLADLVGAYNELYERGGGLVESAHEPIHGSKSGRCLLIDTQKGRWWCRSCRQHGDAASFVMAVHGWQYGQATAWLAERYGAPSGAHTTATNRGTPTSTPRRGQIRWRAL